MKKLKLDCDALKIESFGTDEPVRKQGTVHGHATQWATCPGVETCGPAETCYDSCPCFMTGASQPPICPTG